MTQTARFLLAAFCFTPLAACFEPVEPEVEPAEIQDGAWQLVFANAEMSGDCAMIAVEDAGNFNAIAFVDSDEDELTIWLEGLFLDGSIEGNRFETHGSVHTDSHYDPDQPTQSTGHAPRQDDGEDCGYAEPAADDDGAPPPCMEDPEESPHPREDFSVELDGTILAEDVIRGELSVEMFYGSDSCAFTAEMVGLALDGRDRRDGEPEVQDVPVEEEEEDEDYGGNEDGEFEEH